MSEITAEMNTNYSFLKYAGQTVKYQGSTLRCLTALVFLLFAGSLFL